GRTARTGKSGVSSNPYDKRFQALLPASDAFHHGQMCFGVLDACIDGLPILRGVVAGEGSLVVLELNYSDAIRVRPFHDLMSSGASDKSRAVFVKSGLVQGNVLFVAFLVSNIDH